MKPKPGDPRFRDPALLAAGQQIGEACEAMRSRWIELFGETISHENMGKYAGEIDASFTRTAAMDRANAIMRKALAGE